MEIGSVRLSDASRGGLSRIHAIVEPCGKGRFGRHPTYKRVFYVDRLTERQEKRAKIMGKAALMLTHVRGEDAGSFPSPEQTQC
jgi:hypothetical protein